VIGAAIGLRHLLRAREALADRVTLGVSAGGMILAGAVLSQYPWRSVDGYIGHAWGVQLLALLSVGALAASVVPTRLTGQQPLLEDVGTAADATGGDEPLGDATGPLGH
jgi:arabinofuranan 3-O-arabinosyltransferase